jgi:glycerol-3-phosphate dehydrogenase (NAD(P)+)
VIGAGSFGTAVAVLLARGGFRTTLQARTAEQAERLNSDRENQVYLPGVELPRELRIESVAAGIDRADYVFLGVPSRGLDEVIAGLPNAGLPRGAAIVSLAKGLVPPDGTAPTVMLAERFGVGRVACIGGPAHAREMVHEGAGLVAAAADPALAESLAGVFIRAGVVCEQSDDPVGVELAGPCEPDDFCHDDFGHGVFDPTLQGRAFHTLFGRRPAWPRRARDPPHALSTASRSP